MNNKTLRNIRTKYLQFFYMLLVSFIVESCGGINDETDYLSGGYIARKEGKLSYILPDNIFNEGIYPNVVNIAYDKDFILVLQKPQKKEFVIFLASDILLRYVSLTNIRDTSILKPEEYELMKKNLIADSSFYRMLSKRLSPNNTQKDIIESEKIAEEILKDSKYYQTILSRKNNYWIISHIDKMKYGPFTKEEFINKTDELGVRQNLKQKFEL